MARGKIFMITGKPGSGKTTLWQRLWAEEMEKTAGYITVPYETDGIFAGYKMQDITTGESRIISRRDGERFVGVEETFEGFGAGILRRAVVSEKEVLILDELGRFEKNCSVFLKAVQETVSCGKTVCLILKKEPIPYLERLKETAGGCLIDIDETGREKAWEILTEQYSHDRIAKDIRGK